MDRRTFLTGAMAAGVAARARLARAAGGAVFLVPGYQPRQAHFAGRPVTETPSLMSAVPKGWDGPLVMVTRLDEGGGATRRAAFPVAGHQICARPGRGDAVFCSINGDTLARFDSADLTLAAMGRAHRPGFIGGGHGAYTKDGAALLTSERMAFAPFSGDARAHYGRIAVRDPDTLDVLDSFSAHGVSPHEIQALDDGHHVAIANYGTTLKPGGSLDDVLRYVIEPSLTIVEIASGRLAHKITPSDPAFEIRHLAAPRLDRVFAIQAHMVLPDALPAAMASRDNVYDPDRSDGGVAYLPAPVLRGAVGGGGALAVNDPLLTRQGQSIVYDPAHDQVIATFTSSHAVIAFDGATGAVKATIRTDRLGLRYPRGVALHPDGIHYVVSGSWSDLFTFRRADHQVVRPRCHYETFFEHSHLTIA
jgi:hypothetical protein